MRIHVNFNKEIESTLKGTINNKIVKPIVVSKERLISEINKIIDNCK